MMSTTKRRGAGEGSIFYDPNRERWTAFLDLGTDATGKRQRRKFTGRTRADVLDKLRVARRAAEDGVPLGRAGDTVSALLVDYLARGLPATCRTPKTQQGYAWAIKHHLIPALGARKLRVLTPDDVALMLRSKATEGLSRASLAHIHQVLSRALRWAERNGRVARNVAILVDTPQGKRRVSKALTVEQARSLLSAARADRLEALWTLGLTIPSRPGELTGLCWDCVDFERGIIHFRRALHRDAETGQLYLGELKTEQSRRVVEAPTFVIEALRRRKSAQTTEQLTLGTAWSNPDDLVFTSEAGTPIDAANLRRALRRLIKHAESHHTDEQDGCDCLSVRRPGPKQHRCGDHHECDQRCTVIPGTWTVYELRHSAVSILSAAGVPLELIADAAGHRNSRVTATVYRHNLAPTITSARAPMEAVFGTG